MKNTPRTVILLIVLSAAFIFRFWNLSDQGFISWDEGMYMNEVNFFESVVNEGYQLVHKLWTTGLSGTDILDTLKGWPPSSAKPLHSFFIYITTLFLGNSLFSAQAMAAFFGVCNCFMLFFLVRAYFDELTALIAAAFLSFSGYHIYISRVGGPETNSIFFFLLCLFLLKKANELDKKWPRILAGISYGICFCINYRWIIVLPVVFIDDTLRLFFSFSLQRIKNMAYLFFSFLLVPLICDVPYWPLVFLDDLSVSFRHIPQNVFSYKDQLFHYFFFQSQSGAFIMHDLYIRFFNELNGIAITSLSLIGFIALCIRPKVKKIIFLAAGLIPFVLLSIKSRGNSLRYISIALPFISFYAAYATRIIFVNRAPFLSRTKLVSVVIIAVLCLSSFVPIIPLMNITSGYATAADYVESHRGQALLSTSNAYFEYYFGRNVAEQTPRSLDELEDLLMTSDFKFIVIDFMAHRVLDKETKGFIESMCVPVKSIDNPIGDNQYTLMESLGYRHFIPGYIEKALDDPHGNKIDVYAVPDVLRSLKRRNRLTIP